MIGRFALYGFLKNQRYHGPFLVLLMLERGLGFTELGLLFALQKLTVNLMEVPSGALADTLGRRRCMVASMAAYVVAYVLFATSQGVWPFVPAVVLLGMGDAFRSGTHKAMILQWLRLEGRVDERTKVYGYTRSWSKVGSAVAAPVGAAVVLASARYELAFWLAIVPTSLNLVNLATYPATLEGGAPKKGVARTTWSTLRDTWQDRRRRRLTLESAGMAGILGPVDDLLQPVLLAAAVALPLATELAEPQRAAVLAAGAYITLHLLASAASRQAWRVSDGNEELGARRIWTLALVLFAASLPLLVWGVHLGVIVAFVLLAPLRDLWRPTQVSRLDAASPPELGATVLSIDNQARNLAMMVAGPLVGLALDLLNTGLDPAEWRFWPMGLLGAGVCLLVLGRPSRPNPPRPVDDGRFDPR